MKRPVTITFIITETALYLVFMTMDLLAYGGSTTIAFKYIGILLCVLFTFLCAFSGGEKLIPPAMVFSAAADFFLLVIDRYYIVGILLYLVVQFIYLCYIFKETGKIWIPVRIVCPALVVAVLFLIGWMNGMNLAAGIYLSVILVNLIMCWAFRRNIPLLFSIGLTLFLCSDILVGLYNLTWVLPDGLYAFVRVGMWMIYFPAQVLIALSMTASKERE